MNTSDLDSEVSRRLAFSALRGELHHTGDRVYLGSLDDSVSRYPWENLKPSIGHLNRTLIDAVLFGAPLCVRVGNLLYQPEYLPALLNSSLSPLIDLARVGFIQIQTKSAGINKSIDARVKEGTRSAKAFAAENDWRPGSVIYEKLNTLDSMLSGGPGISQYNADFRKTFRKIMKESAASGIDEFSRVIEVWLSRPEKGRGYQSRDNFEKDAKKVLGDDAVAVQKAMWVANAANHYAYALHLYNASEGIRPMVETSQFDRLADICAIRDMVPAEQAKEILGKRDPVNSALELIYIPEEVYHPKFWPRLAQLVRPYDDDISGSSDGGIEDFTFRRRDFLRAKNRLALKIDDFLENPERFSEKEMFDVAKEYSARLHEALGTHRESQIRLQMHLALQQARIFGPSAAMSSGVGALLGSGAEMAAALTGLPGAGAVLGFSISFALEVTRLNIGDILSRVSPQKIIQDGLVDVDSGGPSTTRDLSRRAESRLGSCVAVRSISPSKAAKILHNHNKDD